MAVKWTVFLMVVELSSGVSVAPPVVKTVAEGSAVDVMCRVPDSSVPAVTWFRALDRSGMELIAVVKAVNPVVTTKGPGFDSLYSDAKISSHRLQLKAFDGSRDTGVYSCAAMGKVLEFGSVTRLQPEPEAKPAPPSEKMTTTETPPPSPAPCVCPTPTVAVAQTQCSLMILAPLAAGCGLLLLLLLCTVLYCHSVRTRRCPHHYKRRRAPGKQLISSAHT